MKRCPACNRVETDETVAFCRADGTRLISDSGSVSADSGTVKFGSAPVMNEIETSILKTDPVYDPLRSDPRFQELVKKFDPPR